MMSEGVKYVNRVEEVQWRVIWFPPDVNHRIYAGTEDRVREKYAEHQDEAPILERRTVVVGPWEAAR